MRPAKYNANGQPKQIGSREYVWDALGRLVEVREEDKSLASYSYNHRSERIGKTARGQSTNYLYEDGQVSAELNEQGQITRQYLYLAGQGIAVIDTPQGQPLSKEELSAHVLLGLDAQNILKHLWHSLAGSDGNEQTAWLHVNHLGAPEAATDGEGQLLWQASYAPFGAARIIKASAQADGKGQGEKQFSLNLRLPGQYADEETGLFYNKQRYYDPSRGEYLTPDPLGTPDGPNGYSYVRYNPLKYIDPEGLVLFAFDGTENTDDSFDISRAERQQLGNGLSNVVRFRDAYNDGTRNYISGVGTTHVDSRYGNITAPALDAAVNRTGTDRINRMLQYFVDTADATPDSESMNVDIIGFSRGAAQARDFSNLVTSSSRQSGTQKGQAVWTDGTYQQGGKLYYRYVDQQYFGQTGNRRYNCQLVNFRFMGLWDSVLSTNSGRSYNLAIPAQFSYVAQAVALNEYRLQPNATYDLAANRSYYNSTRVNLPGDKHWGGFPLESIGASSDAAGRVRVERGFIGAHADIGGGYPDSEGQLSLVALNWMAAQAQIAGVKMDSSRVAVIPTSNPIIHDPSNAIRWGNPVAAQGVRTADGTLFRPEDRQVRGAVRGNSARTMGFNNNSMTNADTHPFISYWDRDPNPRPAGVNTNDIVDTVNLRNRTGSVDMAGYTAWLRQNGYCFVGDSCASARAGNPP